MHPDISCPRPRLSALLPLALLALAVAIPGLAQGDGGSGSSFDPVNAHPICGEGGPSPISMTWLEVPDGGSSARLSGSEATLVLSNESREDVEAHVVLTLDRDGETFRHSLPPLSLLAGERQNVVVDLTVGDRAVPGDSTSFAEGHAFFVRNDRSTVTQAASVPLAFYRETSGTIVAFGEQELNRRLLSREAPEGRLLGSEESLEGLEMVFEVDGSQYRQAPETFDLEAALAREEELARARKGTQDEETER